MRFALIDPFQQRIALGDFPDLRAAQKSVGLTNVDHGLAIPKVCIVVYEFSMYVKPSEQAYFHIRRRLYAGRAVLYQVDDKGRSVDLSILPEVLFMPSAKAVERNIALGLVDRPQLAVNGEVIWEWPQPR